MAVAGLVMACASVAHWVVALPAVSPCLSLLPHSGAICSSARAGALDWELTVEGAVAVCGPSQRRKSQRRNWKLPCLGKNAGEKKQKGHTIP